MNDVNVDTRVCTATAPVGYPADATTEFGLTLLGIYEVSVKKPKDGRAILTDASCCVGARWVLRPFMN